MKYTKIIISLIICTFVLTSCSSFEDGYENKLEGTLVSCSDFELLKEMVEEEGFDVNKPIKDGRREVSPLYLVQSQAPSLKFTEYLLESGADPNVAYGDQTLLMTSTGPEESNGGVEFAELLVKYGADVNKADDDGKNALDGAMEIGYNDAVKLLTDNNIKITEQNIRNLEHRDEWGLNGYNNYGYYDIPKMVFESLKKQGGQYDNSSQFANAVLGNTQEVIDLINKNGNKFDKEVAFYITAFCGVDALDYIVQNGFNLKSKDSGDCSLLWIAAYNGNTEVVKYLIDKGVSLNFGAQYIPDDFDPLKISIFNNHYDIAKLLLEEGAKFNIDKKTGYDATDNGDIGGGEVLPESSLQCATANGNKQMIQLLQDYDYPMNKSTCYGALMIAIQYRQYDLMEYLFKNGGEANYSYNGEYHAKSLIETCGLFGDKKSLSILKKYNANFDDDNSDALVIAAGKDNTEAVEFLTANGMNPNACQKFDDGSETPPLYDAYSSGNYEIMKALVDNGADIDDERIDGIVNIGGGSYKILKYMLDSGLNVNKKSDDGSTLLIYAAGNYREKNVKLLLKAGADIGIKDSEGKTALDYAKDSKDKEIIKLLENTE